MPGGLLMEGMNNLRIQFGKGLGFDTPVSFDHAAISCGRFSLSDKPAESRFEKQRIATPSLGTGK
jgi:hypothetical protein